MLHVLCIMVWTLEGSPLVRGARTTAIRGIEYTNKLQWPSRLSFSFHHHRRCYLVVVCHSHLI